MFFRWIRLQTIQEEEGLPLGGTAEVHGYGFPDDYAPLAFERQGHEGPL